MKKLTMSISITIVMIPIMTTRNYTTISTMAVDMLINHVLLLLSHNISIKIIRNLYTKPVTNTYFLNNEFNTYR